MTADSVRDPTPPDRSEWERLIDHAAHVLPSQGPITAFVHHNTLHAFEALPFAEAVRVAGELYGCEPFLAEERYRDFIRGSRIRLEDLRTVLAEDPASAGPALPARLGTREELHLVLLEHGLRNGTPDELRWLMAETDALRRFQAGVPEVVRRRMVEDTQRWVMRDLEVPGDGGTDGRVRDALARLHGEAGRAATWSAAAWERATLELTWVVCRIGAELGDPRSGEQRAHDGFAPRAPRAGPGVARLVDPVLIRFCASFIDQGLASWAMPERERGLFDAFLELFSRRVARPRWMDALPAEIDRLRREGVDALGYVAESLERRGVAPGQRESVVTTALLALRGFAGLIHRLELAPERAVRPLPPGSLHGYLAVRLLLEDVAREHLREHRDDPPRAPSRASGARHEAGSDPWIQARAHELFQLAQWKGWSPLVLKDVTADDWRLLLSEIGAFSSFVRRRILHAAFERRYRDAVLDALAAHARSRRPTAAGDARPAFQVVTCIDERVESFRRHLEEVAPQAETFGAVGFFGVAMAYRGATEAHDRPLCPANIRPSHRIDEEAAYSVDGSNLRRARARNTFGRLARRLHLGPRTISHGWLASVLGSFATVPLVLRVLAPRTVARARRLVGHAVSPPSTRLLLERSPHAEPGDAGGPVRGYRVDEMADVVASVLRPIGLSRRAARLVAMVGHGSSSLNNPHQAAYDCGACGGGRGGPNARAFAQMANDLRVRQLLAGRGIAIPDDTWFVGAYHNTCDDSVTYYDLDRVPPTHRSIFETLHAALEETRRRNAHERCRRFASAPAHLSPEKALEHVEARAENLAQPRPEYGHATNALCLVGRRAWSRELFLDRRAFLTSYDPGADDAERSLLERLLEAVMPICAGISLEYYFSLVDPEGYGCSSKLPHNITALLGVMDGAMSDMRPGLSWQMVEIHEPMRLLFVIECTPDRLLRILDRHDDLGRLVRGAWVQLATIDPDAGALHVYRDGRFEPHEPAAAELPSVRQSVEWYRGQRGHLGLASVTRRSDAPAVGGDDR